jgi:hypothetical protein
MSNLNTTNRDACDLCGATPDTFHFAMGKLWCPECWVGQRPAVATPPTKSQQMQLADWTAPRPRCAP